MIVMLPFCPFRGVSLGNFQGLSLSKELTTGAGKHIVTCIALLT